MKNQRGFLRKKFQECNVNFLKKMFTSEFLRNLFQLLSVTFSKCLKEKFLKDFRSYKEVLEENLLMTI